LSSYERMLVHELSAKLGLNHYSTGEDEDRFVVVTKIDKVKYAVDNKVENIVDSIEKNNEPDIEESEDTQSNEKEKKKKYFKY